MKHELKTWPEPYEAVVSGRKTFEFRCYDRPYRVGDELLLREWDPETKLYTGRSTSVVVTYLLVGEFGVPGDHACMAIAPSALATLSSESET